MPSGDEPTPQAQQQSFSLANVVPQAPKLNRGIWERAGELYVVTGPIFEGGNLQQIGAGVLVPSDTYKAIYDPGAGTAGAYVCTNTNQPECRTVSVAELARLTGIDPFPAVPETVKAAPPQLSLPHARREPRAGRNAD